MSFNVNRKMLLKLAEIRLDEAQCLLRLRKYHGAYYLAGYSVECLLKAKIAGNVRKHDFPDKALANAAYTHELEKLVGLAGLKIELDQSLATNQDLSSNWSVVKDWKEDKRYDVSIKAHTARDMISSINDPINGIAQWIKNH